MRRRQSCLPHLVHSAYLSRSGVSTVRQSCRPMRQRQFLAMRIPPWFEDVPCERRRLDGRGAHAEGTRRANGRSPRSEPPLPPASDADNPPVDETDPPDPRDPQPHTGPTRHAESAGTPRPSPPPVSPSDHRRSPPTQPDTAAQPRSTPSWSQRQGSTETTVKHQPKPCQESTETTVKHQPKPYRLVVGRVGLEPTTYGL
jgi:hypothetical protein